MSDVSTVACYGDLPTSLARRPRNVLDKQCQLCCEQRWPCVSWSVAYREFKKEREYGPTEATHHSGVFASVQRLLIACSYPMSVHIAHVMSPILEVQSSAYPFRSIPAHAPRVTIAEREISAAIWSQNISNKTVC